MHPPSFAPSLPLPTTPSVSILPSFHSTRLANLRPSPVRVPRRARCPPLCTSEPPSDDNTPSNHDFTCGDAFREWLNARDRGEAPPDNTACASGRVDVLFVGSDNETTSVAAEAIFTDLCERRNLNCFACHSVGTSVNHEGTRPDAKFVEALRFKRKLDVSRKMACKLDKADLESYSLIVCMDDQTRSQVLYMVADDAGRFSEEQEDRIVVLNQYCSEPKLKTLQFRSGPYSKDAINFLLAALVDACNGLLASLLESPPMPQA